MKLYLLRCLPGIGRSYDETDSMVVRATNEYEARQIAVKSAWQDRSKCSGETLDFGDPARSTCTLLPAAVGKAGVIVQSNNPG